MKPQHAFGFRPLVFAAALVLAGCETMPGAQPPAPATASIVQLYQRPAERALINGIRLYEEGAFERSENALHTALAANPPLQDARDSAIAHKYLAFIACAFNRLPECEQSFRSALAADAQFRLSEAEVGHPIWGPVYKRVAAGRPATTATR
jgi:hypothetical protein